MIQFKHLPKGSLIGTGSIVFRHFGSEQSAYRYITPLDTDMFPETLNGYYYESLHGLASGRSSSYVGSVYAKPWLSMPAVKLGKAFSELGNSVSTFDDYSYGDIAVGYSADSTTKGNQALNVWIADYLVTAAEGNALIDAANAHILYELFESDGSVWKAVERSSDGATGYLNEATGDFIQPKGGIPHVGTNLITDEIISSAAGASITTSWKWGRSPGAKSIVIPVSVGKDYSIQWDSSDASVVGNVFRYGFVTNNAPSTSNIVESPRERTTPQDKASVTVTASAPYLVIEVIGETGIPGSFPNNVEHLSVCEIVGYEPPVLLMTPPRPDPEPDPDEPVEEEGDE